MPHASWFPTALAQRQNWTLDELYELVRTHPSDIRAHVPTLRSLAARSEVVVELGVRYGVSTVALLAGDPELVWSCDLNRPDTLSVLMAAAGGRWQFTRADSREFTVAEADGLFIDTRHTGGQLFAELRHHARSIRSWIAIHDTELETMQKGLARFLTRTREGAGHWLIRTVYPDDHGLTVLTRQPSPVVLPTS